VLLDTHVWIWAAEGDARRLGRRAIRLVDRARSQGDLHVCVASMFEIAALYAAGRLELVQPAERWMRASIDDSGLRVIDISTAIAVDAGLLPATALPDPFDRLMIAAAMQAGHPLLTCDLRILAYARDTRRVRVVDARS
jgi:PIN domain nuclease of toxin-antitoxin system